MRTVNIFRLHQYFPEYLWSYLYFILAQISSWSFTRLTFETRDPIALIAQIHNRQGSSDFRGFPIEIQFFRFLIAI
jgi:hypothetical protein